MEENNYFRRDNEQILQAITLFCNYHELLHKYVIEGKIKSSLDRGAFTRPSDVLPEEIIKLLGSERKSNSFAYGTEAGDHLLRERIAELENARHKTKYSAENIAIMPGAWAGLEFALQEVMGFTNGKCNAPRIAVIGPTLYQMFYSPIKHFGAEITAFDFTAADKKHILDVESDEESIDEIFSIKQRQKPKAIVITNPNNPDGKYVSTEVLRKIIEKCEQQEIYVVIDELQNFFQWDNSRGLNYAAWIQSPNVIRIDSCSKRYALAEYRIGWIIADEKMLGNRMDGIIGRMSGIMGNAPRAANTALIYLLQQEIESILEGNEFLGSVKQKLLVKKEYVTRRLKVMDNIKAIYEPDACINLALQCNYSGTDMQLAERLMQQGTLIMPASGYGYNTQDCVLRITFAEREEKLEHSLNVLERVLN